MSSTASTTSPASPATPRQRRLLHRRPRAAAREEDGQPGRSDRLPPLLRRRAGEPGRRHHVLRVPGRRRGARRRRHGAHDRLARRLRGGARLLGRAARRRARRRHGRRSRDPEGLQHELVVANVPDEPLIADHPEIPRELALQGFEGVRAYARDAERAHRAASRSSSASSAAANRWETRGDSRGGWIEYEAAPEEPGIPGAGTVHHVAWASTMDDQERVARARRGGRRAGRRRCIDRFWFRSIYFREPSGVLFEIATLGPGLRDRRGSGASRREAHPAARVRASSRAGRADPDAAAESARALERT